jgi:hypothetical protein
MADIKILFGNMTTKLTYSNGQKEKDNNNNKRVTYCDIGASEILWPNIINLSFSQSNAGS